MKPKQRKLYNGWIVPLVLGVGLIWVLGWLIGAGSTAVARAATFPVTKFTDSNDGICDADCSLREAIIVANVAGNPDIITLPTGFYSLTIAGAGEDAAASGDLDITTPLTIIGAGPDLTINVTVTPPTVTVTPMPTKARSQTYTPTPAALVHLPIVSNAPSITLTPAPMDNPIITDTPTCTPSPTDTPTATLTATDTPTNTPTPTATSVPNRPPGFTTPLETSVMTKHEYNQFGRLIGAVTTMTISAASDPDGDPITYTWSATNGTIIGNGLTATWTRVIRFGQVEGGDAVITATDNHGNFGTYTFKFE